MRITSASRTIGVLAKCMLARCMLASVLLSAPAGACQIMTSSQPANIDRAAVIFRGEILSYKRLAEQGAELEFKVTQTIKGDARESWRLVWDPNRPIDPRTIDDFKRTYSGDVVVGVATDRSSVPIEIYGFTFRWPSLLPRILHADCEDAFILRWGEEHEPILLELKTRKLIPTD